MLDIPRTASELALRVLTHSQGGVRALLNLVDGGETEWLELKAAAFPKDGHFSDGDTVYDYRWDVAKAVVALANSVGGVVLLGLDDAGSPVGLDASDPEKIRGAKGHEVFRREVVLGQVLFPGGGWKTRKYGSLQLSNRELLERKIDLKEFHYEGQTVLAILVDALDENDDYIAVVAPDNKYKTRSEVYIRTRGAMGGVKPLETTRKSVSRAHEDFRKSFSQTLGGVWQRFLDGIPAKPLARNSLETVASSIGSYLGTLRSQLERLDAVFTPLDADERADTGVFDPEAEERPEVSGLDEDWLPTGNAIDENSDGTSEEQSPKMMIARRGGVLELLEQEARAVLLGEPGAGKSTCLGRKALSAAADWQPGRSWALLVPLCEYTESGLRALLLKRLSRLEWVDLEDEIVGGRVTLLLDALNECPAVRYEECCQDISGLLRDYPVARVVISSRLTHNPRQFGLRTFDIRPMGRDQQQRFLETYLGGAGLAIELLERLYCQPGAEFIASSPVLLRMVAEVGRDGSDFPTGRASLYRRFLEGWHRREAKKNEKSGSPALWPLNRVREALSLLAFRTRAEGRVSCHVNFARQTLVHMMGDDTLRFLRRLAQGLLLVLDEEGEFLHFSHETIQEYLAAEYLAAHPGALTNDFLQMGSARKSRNWAMPLVFVFELVSDPPEGLLQSAWIAEPLLVSVALRDNDRLAALSVDGDPWLRGVLRVLRGDDATIETDEIAYASRLPPKYPLPDILVDTLRGTPFWYAGQTHAEGTVRLERLRRFLLYREYPWIELLPEACAGQPAWVGSLNPAQRLLLGAAAGTDITSTLDKVTVAELCALLRFRKISIRYFKSNWKNALRRSSETQIDMDLISLLRADPSVVVQFDKGQRAHLNCIGKNWKLSFRLLNVLVRAGVVTVEDIREDPGRIDDIVGRMSPMNALRFKKSGVISRQDIPSAYLKKLAGEMSPREARDLLAAGLMTRQDIPMRLIARMSLSPTPGRKVERHSEQGDKKQQVRSRVDDHREREQQSVFTNSENSGRKYSNEDLATEVSRKQVETEISSKEWEATVLTVLPVKNIGFIKHPSFSEDVIFRLDKIENLGDEAISKGDVLRVRLTLRLNTKRNAWSFAVRGGNIVKKCSG